MENNLSNTIDDDYLKNTEYIESMEKLGYGLKWFTYPTSINGLNLYTYCNNDPVNYVDHEGKSGSKYLMFSHLSSGNIFRTISFGHEIRLSNGWEKGENFLYSFLGYFGISSYHTKTNGKDGSIYFLPEKQRTFLIF